MALLDDRRFDGHPLGLEPALTPALDRRLDRVQATRVQDFRGIANVFHYELAFARGTIDVAGNQATISSTSKLGALAFRRLMIVLTALAGIVGTYALWATYELQHPWFHSRGCGSLLVAGGVTTAVGVTWLVGATMLASAARKAARPLWATSLGIVAVALTVVAWRAKAPSAEQARAYLAASRPEAAEYEAVAVRQLGTDPLGASGVLDELHFRRFEAAAKLEEKAQVLDQAWNLAEPRQRATDRFLALADARATDAAFSAPGLRTLAGVVKPIDPLRTTQWEGRAELLEARDATARRDWEHAIDHLEAAATRLGAEPGAKHMRRLESTLEAETRSHIVKARATRDPIEKDAAWTEVRRLFAATARVRGLTHSSPPADWLALDAKTKTEATAAANKAEAAAKKSKAPAKKRVGGPHAGKGR